MGLLGEIGSALWDFGSNLFKTGYNLYTNKRDFDYQKDLQQQIFEREDTAIQRRMEDLKAAGLNPNLANGQAASAGAVVSRSNTNDIDVGSMLDAQSAIQTIKGQKLQNKIANQEAKSNDIDLDLKKFQANFTKFKILADMGIPTSPYIEDGEFNLLLPDNQYVNPNDINYFKKLNAEAFKYENVVNDYLREGYALMNEQQKAAADVMLKNQQAHQISQSEQLELLKFMVNQDIDYKNLELAYDKLGLDSTKMFTNEFMKALPYILLFVSGGI